MIIYQRFENFRSIGKPQELNFLAGSDKSHDEIIKETGDSRVLPVIPIYGGNATGKTNFLKATETIQDLIAGDFDLEDIYNPCKFYDKKDTSLEIIFIKNNLKYYFKVTFNNEEITEEALYYYPNGRISKIYHKENDSFSFGLAFEKDLKKYSEDVSIDMTFLKFLNTILKGKINFIDEAGEFLREDIIIVREGAKEIDLKEAKEIFKKSPNDNKLKEFIEKFYSHLNTGVKGIQFSTVDIKDKVLENLLQNDKILSKLIKSTGDIENKLEKELFKKLLQSKLDEELELVYQIDKKEVRIRIEEESQGVQKIFTKGIYFADALANGKVILYDELEMGFHVFLAKKIIELFMKNRNKNNAQLIFTTHNTTFLDLNIFRRDQIYFTERTLSTEYQSKLRPLAMINGIRKSTDIEKGYLNEKYCSLPTFEFEWGDSND